VSDMFDLRVVLKSQSLNPEYPQSDDPNPDHLSFQMPS